VNLNKLAHIIDEVIWAWGFFTFLITFVGIVFFVIPTKGWNPTTIMIETLLFGGLVGFGWLYVRKVRSRKSTFGRAYSKPLVARVLE